MNLELQTGYIADAIIDVKLGRFGEKFASVQEILTMQELIEQRLKNKGLKVKFIDTFFSNYFRVDNNVVTKYDESESLKKYISNKEIRKTIYDYDFIYYCLCQMLINKLNNSIEHTCANCATNTTSECEKLLLGKKSPTTPNNCNRWTYNILKGCANNISTSEQLILEENQSQKRLVKKLKKDDKHIKGLSQMIRKDFEEDE